ncbi:MAG: sporulation protein YunB, partial [Clostridia bacterium]|nr:sporulation protein YunB [Clostridia bacterium]
SQINLLKSYLVKDVNEYISNYDVAEVGIPIGTFTGSDYLSGMGPEIDVSVQFSGVAVTEIFSEFTSAGINQTCHRIVVKTQVEISVITLGKRLSDSVENECCIAETVIVGTVPETYADIIKNY